MDLTRRGLLKAATAAAPALLRGQNGRRPNILFLFPDQWRFDWNWFREDLSLRLPNLYRLSNRGMRFDQAIVASPLCAPSRACLAAGVEYERCGVPSNSFDYPLDRKTYYERLRDAGYHVLGCGKLDLHKKTEDWGLDGRRLVKQWGFTDAIDSAGKGDAIHSTKQNGHPMDPFMAHLEKRGLLQAHLHDFEKRKGPNGYWNTEACPLPDPDYGDTWVTDNGLELLRSAPAGKPWHLVVNFPGPHNPMDVTASMHRSVQGRHYPPPLRSSEGTNIQHNAIRQNYSAMCENIDTQIGRLLAEVERCGETANTIVVFSSDHGEMLGDHGRWAKKVPYHPSVAVPLLVAGPGVAPGVSHALVSHIDLAGTFLDFAGLPVPGSMDSLSLRNVLSGAAKNHRKALRSGLGEWRMVWDGRFKLITNFEIREGEVDGADPGANHLLFDLKDDPGETRNIASQRSEIVEQMRGQLTPG